MKNLRSYPHSEVSHEEINLDHARFTNIFNAFITSFINALKHFMTSRLSLAESKHFFQGIFTTAILVKSFTYLIGLIWLLIIIITIF